jgi:hypothetical protein
VLDQTSTDRPLWRGAASDSAGLAARQDDGVALVRKHHDLRRKTQPGEEGFTAVTSTT